MNTRITVQGDGAITIRLSDHRDQDVARQVLDLARQLDQARIDGIVDVVPALVSVTCILDADVDPEIVLQQVTRVFDEPTGTSGHHAGALVEIPVCFEPHFATDLVSIARDAGLSVDNVIELHLGAEYRVAMIGFFPGFPYLEGLPGELVRPRRSTPRDRIPSGSVAIAGEHCGIYPVESPGGWWIIGWTPLQLFNPGAPSPALLEAGDRCRFRRIKN